MDRRALLHAAACLPVVALSGCAGPPRTTADDALVKSAAFILLSEETGTVTIPGFNVREVKFRLGERFLSDLQAFGEDRLRNSRPQWTVPAGGNISAELRAKKLGPTRTRPSLSLTTHEARDAAAQLNADLLFVFQVFYMIERAVPSGFGLTLLGGDSSAPNGVRLFSGMRVALHSRSGESLSERWSPQYTSTASMDDFGLTTRLSEIERPDVLGRVRESLLALAKHDLTGALARHGYS